jgi:hypothetical protein
VVGQFLVMEMEVFKPVVTMLVAERLGGERERRSASSKNQVLEAGFLAIFGPQSLHLWSMKIKSIYRRWKRDTLSLLVQNLIHWFDPKASQPLVQSNNDELSVLCRKNGWSGWPLWGGSTTSKASISLNGLY